MRIQEGKSKKMQCCERLLKHKGKQNDKGFVTPSAALSQEGLQSLCVKASKRSKVGELGKDSSD